MIMGHNHCGRIVLQRADDDLLRIYGTGGQCPGKKNFRRQDPVLGIRKNP
jgi:hypothetical protein